METFLVITVLILALALVGIFFFKQNPKEDTNIHKRIDDLNQNMTVNLNKVTDLVVNQLNSVSKQMDERLKENNKSLERQHQSVGERLDTAAKVVNTVNSRLSKIEEGNKRIYDVGKDISSLQELLKAPKLRGGLGELFLNDLLGQIFPQENYTMQYSFKTGDTVDAVIHVRDNHLIAIDSKFPLENFKKMYEEDDEKVRADHRKMFINDVKKRIDEISSKYILPDEGTFDFALMYVPAENVYYEMIVKQQASEANLSAYAFGKKVIPVSPNTLYIYLQTILIGLKGFQIEKKAAEILTSLSRLRGDFEKFGDDFTLVGKHLTHARGSYENSEKRLSRFTDKLTQVESLSIPNQQEKLLK
jgi:DNA recombination protein RmuC